MAEQRLGTRLLILFILQILFILSNVTLWYQTVGKNRLPSFGENAILVDDIVTAQRHKGTEERL